MNLTYFILPIFLAITSLIQASSDDRSSQPSRSGRVPICESEQFRHFQTAVQSVSGYAGVVQKVQPLTGDETETPIDKNPFNLLKNFQKALDKGFPGRYDTLSFGFFEAMGRSVGQMWVAQSGFSFDIPKIWEALINSKEPEIVRFLTTHPIQEGGKLYAYAPQGALPSKPDLSNTIRFDIDKVATHFPRTYTSR